MLLRSPPLPPEPIKWLKVTNGFLLTAEHWQQAHDFHRKHQTIHYQSLNQGGIVWGLGVRLIDPPNQVADAYRDRRWIEIQPGIAIDASGNPIVVLQPISFRIASAPPPQGTLTVYITIRYVDPDRLQGQVEQGLIQETTRLDEIITPPTNGEVELCRVRLQPGEVQLQPALDVFAPGGNTLDLRYRQQVQARPQKHVAIAQVAQGQPEDAITGANFAYLLQSAAALYPMLQGTVEPLTLPAAPDLLNYELLYLTRPQLLALDASALEQLQHFLTAGGVVMVELSAQEANLAALTAVQQKLQTAIANLVHTPDADDVRRDLQTELAEVEKSLAQQVQDLVLSFHAIAPSLGLSLDPAQPLSPNHPLCTQPFLFAQLPVVQETLIHLFNWGGLVVVIGSLSSAWGVDHTVSLPRDTIRTAQELGINLLHFAWRRRQLTQAQQS